MNKTEQVKALITKGERKAALKLASDFRIGVSMLERSIMKRGYECYHYPDIYRQMGVDVEATQQDAWRVLTTLTVLQDHELA